MALLEAVVPRHLQIILEINRRFLDRVSLSMAGRHRAPEADVDHRGIGPRQVRMAHLAMAGSHAINGVSRIHTEAIKTSLAPDYFDFGRNGSTT